VVFGDLFANVIAFLLVWVGAGFENLGTQILVASVPGGVVWSIVNGLENLT
jgi:hypothetical protein